MVATTSGAWIGLVMYAVAPSCIARWRSSIALSVLITTIGTSLCRSSMRTRCTSFSPSMIGILMSVRIRSNFSEASFLRALMPSPASVMAMFLIRPSANTMSCRIIGESSTTRQEYSATAISPSRRCKVADPRHQLRQGQLLVDAARFHCHLGHTVDYRGLLGLRQHAAAALFDRDYALGSVITH